MRRPHIVFVACHLLLCLIALSSTTGCSSSKPAPKPEAAAKPPDLTPPGLRLPTTVVPTRHEATLSIDPATEDFTGTIAIDLDVKQPVSVIWMNGREIDVKTVTLPGYEKTIYPTKELIGLVLSKPLPAGKARLAMTYAGKMHRNDGTGIYTAKEGDDWYAYTQFEAQDAREAFPCFDEPSFKAPWKISIKTKKTNGVFGNAPIAKERAEGGDKIVELEETKPLPSYLVAFAVGPFDTVDAGKTRGGAPIRIVVPRGRGGDVAYPTQATRPIVDLLEDYFGMPYPYPKLDMLACAVFNAGAMENPGLITWQQSILLTKPAEVTLRKQQTYAAVAAHELAHHWFGDYVTLAWWDDTWLNEAFASWMAGKVIDQWKPEWDGQVEVISAKNAVMKQDSLEAARQVRQPIRDAGDVKTAFDGITYEKGMAVIGMIERHVGVEAFQQGVRAYLANHAWGNATYDDFVTAIGGDTKPMFDSFILQSGVPVVGFELKCDGAPSLALTQQRYAPTGSKIDPKRTWTVPVCVRWGAGETTGRDCTTLSSETGTLALTAPSCPKWLMPNEAEVGYYRMSPKGKLLDNLLAAAPTALTLSERIGLLGDVNALVATGELGGGAALGLVAALSKDKDQRIVDASTGIVAAVEEVVTDKLRPNYQRLVAKLYRERAVELGFTSKPNEDDKTKQLRPTLVSLVAEAGNDKTLADEATKLAWKWLDDHAAVQPEMTKAVLGIAAHYGDQKLFDRLHAEAKKATDRQERQRFLAAMGSFSDPVIAKQAWAISISDEFELREGMGLLQGGFVEPKTRTMAYEFVKKNFDTITAKLPEPFRPYIAYTFVPLCDNAKKPEIEAFFKQRIEKLDGGPRIYAQAIEQLGLCSAQREAQTPAVVAFLQRQ